MSDEVDLTTVVVTESELRQQPIYDARYREDLYDQRSAVRVLPAENAVLEDAFGRLLTRDPRRITWFDFGFGTGRVTIEFAERLRGLEELCVIGYDISPVGLARAAQTLEALGFVSSGDQRYERRAGGVRVEFILILGTEDMGADTMAASVRELAGTVDLCTSWYSGLGHIFPAARRSAFFAELSGLTSGELVIAVAATGDLVDAQVSLKSFQEAGGQVGYPCESAQDLLYRTELGQVNFWHVFGVDLNEEMARLASPGRHLWIEAIRFPGDEFTSEAEALDNHALVTALNARTAGRPWEAEDFRACHTVALRRSAV